MLQHVNLSGAATLNTHRSMHGCAMHYPQRLWLLLQIAAQAGLGLPEWYDAGKVSIENSKISFGECLPWTMYTNSVLGRCSSCAWLE
jgi:hypothetical protein